VSHDPIILQAAIAIPVSMALVVYALLRWDRMILNLLVAVLLSALIVWLVGLVMKLGGGPVWIREIGLDVEMSAVLFMPPVFLITMAYFARSSLFEETYAPSIALLVVSTTFLALLLTDDYHHTFFADRSLALAGAHPREWGGPAYWAVQIWCGVCDLAAFAFLTRVLLRGRTRAERGRAAMIFGAVALPVLTHVVHLLRVLPIDYSLAPGTLALTAVFFVQGVHRYGLLGGQTIVRHDLIEHLDDGLLLTDQLGTVLDANRAAERVIGATRDNMRGVPLPEVLSLLDPDERSRDLGDRILALPLDGSRETAEIHTGDERIIEVSAGAVPNLGSQPAGRFVSILDRTAQRRSERVLRERQKLESIGILAAGVAHEVNNPLAYVRANLVHLRSIVESMPKSTSADDPADPDELGEVLDESIGGLDRIARIVESMLRFSRKPDEALRLVDVGDVVDEALRLAALQRDATVLVERREGTVPRVLASPERLVQVLLNLFLNAKQALGDRRDGVIETETALEGDHVVIRVRDNGPGIAPEIQQRIFDPFFTTRPPDGGTGLGLSIAFDIVREHGGTLELSSKPGFGACFTVRLAAAPGEAPSA
jgi:PAS domain S-box-containing protein